MGWALQPWIVGWALQQELACGSISAHALCSGRANMRAHCQSSYA